MMIDALCSYHFSDLGVGDHISSGLVDSFPKASHFTGIISLLVLLTAFLKHLISQVVILLSETHSALFCLHRLDCSFSSKR